MTATVFLVLTNLPKHGGAQDNTFLVTHHFRDRTPKRTDRGGIELLKNVKYAPPF
jgi:hypothetical protein